MDGEIVCSETTEQISQPDVKEPKKMSGPSGKGISRRQRTGDSRKSILKGPKKTIAFPVPEVETLIETEFQKQLDSWAYSASECTPKASEIADSLKRGVQELTKGRRNKIVAHVIIGQRPQGSVSLASRSYWNAHSDARAEGMFSTESVHAIAIVYGLNAD